MTRAAGFAETGAAKTEQAHDAPAADKNGENDFRRRESSGNDMSDAKKVEPDERHEDEPEDKDGEGSERAPGRGASGRDKHDTGRKNLHNMAKRSAADKTNKHQAENNANQAGVKAAVSGWHGRLQFGSLAMVAEFDRSVKRGISFVQDLLEAGHFSC